MHNNCIDCSPDGQAEYATIKMMNSYLTAGQLMKISRAKKCRPGRGTGRNVGRRKLSAVAGPAQKLAH